MCRAGVLLGVLPPFLCRFLAMLQLAHSGAKWCTAWSTQEIWVFQISAMSSFRFWLGCPCFLPSALKLRAVSLLHSQEAPPAFQLQLRWQSRKFAHIPLHSQPARPHFCDRSLVQQQKFLNFPLCQSNLLCSTASMTDTVLNLKLP